jgi:hypothetical protein
MFIPVLYEFAGLDGYGVPFKPPAHYTVTYKE